MSRFFWLTGNVRAAAAPLDASQKMEETARNNGPSRSGQTTKRRMLTVGLVRAARSGGLPIT